LILREYQRRAREYARALYREGKRAILYVAPTGAGKTVVLADTIAAHVAHADRPRVVFYAHRRELVKQAADTLGRLGLEVGAAGEGAERPVQVVSTQGAIARGELQPCTMAVFDEAHHYSADLWGQIAKTHRDAGATLVGATATPERGDGRPLDHMFDAMVVVAQVSELVKIGALVGCDVIEPSRNVPKGKLATTPVKAHLAHSKGRRNVVFAPHVQACRDFARGFEEAGVSCRVVEGKLASDDRDRYLAEFAAGEVEVLVNCMVLTEGWDCPPCETITIARPCGSTGLFIQIAGRGARSHPGKTRYTLLDLCGVVATHGRPDDDRDFSLEGVGIGGAKSQVVTERLCKTCGGIVGPEGTCLGCGEDHGLVTPTDANIALAPWKQRMQTDDESTRIARLAKWIDQARRSGHKWQTATYRFRGAYGVMPSGKIVSAALATTRGAETARGKTG
jgi:superfamily II DNA or RNA helicase